MTGNPDRESLYRQVVAEVRAVLDGVHDPISAMATTACILHHRHPATSWVGFYRVVAPGLLRVGPYQGPLGCLEIPFERGVCGAAARSREPQLVADVTTFPGHIACDAEARSEVVVPVFDASGELVGVLDLDSHLPAAFDEADRDGLERLAEVLRPHL